MKYFQKARQIIFLPFWPQQARKFKKVQAKRLVKSNKSFFFVKLHFWPYFKLQKKWFRAKKFFVKLMYLILRVFLAWTFLNFMDHCANIGSPEKSHRITSLALQEMKSKIWSEKKMNAQNILVYVPSSSGHIFSGINRRVYVFVGEKHYYSKKYVKTKL